jgi:hypothetical protein
LDEVAVESALVTIGLLPEARADDREAAALIFTRLLTKWLERRSVTRDNVTVWKLLGSSSCKAKVSASNAKSATERPYQPTVSSVVEISLTPLRADRVPGRLHRIDAAERGGADQRPAGLRTECERHMEVGDRRR